MKRYICISVCLVFTLVMGALLSTGALAQCSGGDHSSMHQQGYYGQTGTYGQAPVQTAPNAVAPGYVPPAPPVSGYTVPQQDTSGSGQMMNQGGMGSGHSGHMGTN